MFVMKHPSKRTLRFATMIALLFVLAACGGGGSGGTADLAATQAALEATQAALESAQVAETEVENSQSDIEAESETGAGSEAQPFYVEEWDEANPNWSYFLVRGEEDEFDLYTQDGNLVWEIPATYVWLYLTYDAYTYEDVVVETHVRNLGQNSNSVVLVCRYNDRGWYEFNIASSGLYWIYRYETADGEFVQLYNGGSENIKIGVGENTYTAVCDGDKLSLYINGEHTRTVSDLYFLEGLAGVGLSSFDLVPVEVLMDYVSISAP
jgi:hypothetical protein